MTRRWLALGAVLVLALVGAACSDDASVTVATSPNTAAPTTTAAANTAAATTAVPDTSITPAVDPVKGNPIDPCSLLTVDEIGSALQVPVGAPAAGPQSNLPNPLGQRTCTWTTNESPPRSVAVSVVTTQSAQMGGAAGGTYTARQLFEDTKPLAEAPEPVPGLGDDAFFGAVAGMQMTVLKGDVYFSVTVPFGITDADAAVVRALAPLAVARLP